jgi:hypothetical protein
MKGLTYHECRAVIHEAARDAETDEDVCQQTLGRVHSRLAHADFLWSCGKEVEAMDLLKRADTLLAFRAYPSHA